MKAVLPGLYTFTGLLMGRVYLIEDVDGLTIIDAGLDSAAPKVVKQLEAAGRKASDVKRILVTHGHPDHVGGLPGLKTATGARVYASAQDRAAIEGREPIERVPEDRLSGPARMMRPPRTVLKGTPVDEEIKEGDTLPIFNGIHVLAVPGHSPGHLAFWQPNKRVVFCGDVIMRLPWLRPPFAAFTVDMAQNDQSLKRVIDLEPSVVCFGHGNPLTDNAAGQIRQYARKRGVI